MMTYPEFIKENKAKFMKDKMNSLISKASHSRKIRALGVLKGVNWFAVARQIGVDRSAVYKTIDGIIKSHRIRKAIADALDVAYKELWHIDNTKNNDTKSLEVKYGKCKGYKDKGNRDL